MTTLAYTAQQWVDNGIAVIPAAYRGKQPTVPTWREFQKRLPTANEISRWFMGRFHNLAIITGWRGLVVLDFDHRDIYRLWREWSRENAPRARASRTIQTSRGVHVYLFIDEPVQTMKAGSIDVKAGGGYVLAPPSIHPTGTAYRTLSDAPIARVPALSAVLPAGLLDPVAAPAPVIARVETLESDPWASAMNPALLADTTIATRLARYDILSLFPDARRRGTLWWAKCPLHNDHNPSVTIDGHRARCWAGCLWGDYADWYAAIHRMPLAQVLQVL